MTTQFPCRFGKYLLLERISTGGMAEVFRAKSFGVAGFEKSFALKRILPHISEDPEFIAMFIDEAKIAARLHHANICQIVEFGRVGDYYFQVMEYVPGCDLRKIRRTFQARGRTVPPEIVLLAIEKVCDGLDYAHRKVDVQDRPMGIIHRDVSPQNVLISFEGAVKLIDFGIAKAASRAAKTQAGQIKGKFSYLSPEQITGQDLDGRLDIFALGIVTWELLTGRDLFVAENEMEILRMILRANVPPPSQINPSLPPELDHVVMQALAVNPDDRYQSADEFMEEIQRVSYRLNLRISPTGVQRFMAEEFAEELTVEQEKVKRFWDLSKETRLPESEEDVEDPRKQSVITFSGRRLRPPSERPSSWESSKHITVIQGVASDSSEAMQVSEEDVDELVSTRSTAARDDIMELSDDDIEELLDEEDEGGVEDYEYGEPQEAEEHDWHTQELDEQEYQYEEPQEAEEYEWRTQEADEQEYEEPQEAQDHEWQTLGDEETYGYEEPLESEEREFQYEEPL